MQQTYYEIRCEASTQLLVCQVSISFIFLVRCHCAQTLETKFEFGKFEFNIPNHYLCWKVPDDD